MKPAIWVVGATAVGKHTLSQSITGLECDRSKSYCWQIDTKYYTADVDIHAFRFSQQHPDDDAPEAVVIVIDVTDEKTFLAAKAWSSSDSWESAEIKILAANKVDQLLANAGQRGEPTRPKWVLEAMEWCTDNMCEYVEVCCGVPDKDAGLVLDSEQQGVARIVNALQAHMWPGMTRKEVKHVVPRVESDEEEEEEAALTKGEPELTEPAAGSAASSGRAGSNAAGQQQQQQRQTEKEQQQEDQQREAAALAAMAAAVLPKGGGKEQDGEESKAETFEQLLQELQGARERLAGLPDEKRRHAAAELAMRVAMMMDDGDDSDPVDDTDADLLRDV